MRAFLTGGLGFVGGWLREHLADVGDDVVLSEADVTNGEALRKELVEAAPDAVYHLAAFTHVGQSWDAPDEAFAVNALGTLHLLEAARACAVAPRVLLVGSAEVYGIVRSEQLPITEDTPLAPVSPYAVSKVASEYLGMQAHLGYGVPVVWVRAFNHVGPGQTPTFLIPAIAQRIVEAEREGTTTLSVGNVSARRDFTDVRDVVRAYRLLVERATPGRAYNVCSGRDVLVADVVGRMLELAGSDLELVPDPDLQRPVDIPILRGDASRLRAETGWTPQIELDDTLRDVLAAARTQT